MTVESPLHPADKKERYALILAQVKAITAGETHLLANMANIAALLYDALGDVNWVGFYLLEQGELLLGPFCGKPACLRIKPGRGVCGSALSRNQTLCVDDVHAFPGHIACDSASQSELVTVLHSSGKPIAVLDIDSPILARFGEVEQRLAEDICSLLESTCHMTASYTLT